MSSTSFSTQIDVRASREGAVEAITHVEPWRSQTVRGTCAQVGDEFIYADRGVGLARFRVVRLEPGARVVWEVMASDPIDFGDHEEWTGTTAEFSISTRDDTTTVRFTHRGVLANLECYEACSRGWDHYVMTSLRDLIETGTGQPIRKDTA